MERDYGGIERRRFKRIRANFLIVYKVTGPWEVQRNMMNRDLVAVMHDLSEGGAAILTNTDIPQKGTVRLRFTLINYDAVGDSRVKTIEVPGEVCYSMDMPRSEKRLGIRFTDIKSDDRMAIAELAKLFSESR